MATPSRSASPRSRARSSRSRKARYIPPSGSNLPVSLDGVSVTINGKPAYVEYISSTQINAIAPDDDTIGQVPVQVTTPQGTSYAATARKQKLSPGFLTYQSGTASYIAAVHLDGSLVGPIGPSSRPAIPGEVIETYGTGFGPTSPATATSQLISQPTPLAWPATVSVGRPRVVGSVPVKRHYSHGSDRLSAGPGQRQWIPGPVECVLGSQLELSHTEAAIKEAQPG